MFPNTPASEAVFLDTETTRAVEEPGKPVEVIELAWAHLDFGVTGVKRYKPTIPPQWGALATHHILPGDLADERPSAHAPADVPPASYWIGHNIDFDWKALGSPPGVRRICTLALARSLWPEVDSHSLSALVYFTQGASPATRERLRSAHSALADIEFCRDIFRLQVDLVKPADLETMWRASEEARIPRVFTFGKFKGMPIKAADRGYANWYRRQADPDPYVLEAFRRAGLL